jgi:penicillin-binding protein 2
VFGDWPNDQIPIAGKTGTAEVEGKGDTSWFASFGPVNDPQFAVVVTIPESGTGATYAAPAAKEIWKAIYGVGRPGTLPGGKPPEKLPTVNKDGTISSGLGQNIPQAESATPGPPGANPPPATNPAPPAAVEPRLAPAGARLRPVTDAVRLPGTAAGCLAGCGAGSGIPPSSRAPP